MDILYLLIPISVLLVLFILGIFGWALHSGQLDDVEPEGARILESEESLIDADQSSEPAEPQQSRESN